MILTVDSNDRLFFIKQRYNSGRNPVVCNARQIPEVCESMMEKGVEYIKEMWNGKLVKVSKKNLIELMEGEQLDTKFLERV